ncbi:glycosyltransferase [Arthrobacter sp. ISL-95]|uniref:glycosyltransferase n=1 Tax=Arthrobacter sp. ISL-95 TaxID=2819116 RepID=UPI001BE9FE52|nr:glycosyltransferase [Arthrobacter sp. ISL-95]MBT2585637.1 glycosyltransferase [Arthrobacter sp. ISL-95]
MLADEKAHDHAFDFVVIGHAIDSNALGRAISMAMVAEAIGPTRLLAFGDGPIWKGASQFQIDTEGLTKKWKKELAALPKRSSSRTVFWLAKGISPVDRLATYISRAVPDALIILDLDDDDAGLAEAFTRQSLINKLKLNPVRRGSARRIRQAQARIARVAHGFTFSSNSLATVYPKSFQPSARIPHVREDIGDHSKELGSTPRVTFGSLGTLRPHKGSGLLLELMRQNKDLTLVTFANCGLGKPESTDENWIELPPNMPLHEAYSQVDVSLIPITDDGPGAQFQLPAKLVDSMRSSVPVLASPTPAIDEIASEAYTPLQTSLSPSAVAEQIRTLANGHSGRLARQRFEALLTPVAAAGQLSSLLSVIDSRQ